MHWVPDPTLRVREALDQNRSPLQPPPRKGYALADDKRTRRPTALRKLRVVKAAGAAGPEVASRGSGLTTGPLDHERESFTTGRPMANGRGLTSGWGMINGTGMVRESEFHYSVGRFNGSGVTKASSMASRDGMTNGSGLTKGGMAADGGMTNGSGLTKGEGMTNGCGLVRPMDPTLPPVEPPRRRRASRRRPPTRPSRT